MRIWNKEILNKAGEEVELAGWVHKRRDHGKIIFIDLRDRSGINQLVFVPSTSSGQGHQNNDVYARAELLRPEWVIRIRGEVAKRPKGMENPDLETGEYEIQVNSLEVIAEAKTPPFELDNDGYDLGDEIRMKYRYLDLRRERMRNNLILRHKITTLARDYLNRNEFIEIETPMLPNLLLS